MFYNLNPYSIRIRGISTISGRPSGYTFYNSYAYSIIIHSISTIPGELSAIRPMIRMRIRL